MDSNLRDLVLEQMQKIVNHGGKKKRGGAKESELKEIYGDYKNQYVDDGSFEFEKLRAQIIKQIANELFGSTDVNAVKAVPQATINKVMANLKKGRDLDIKALKKQDAEAKKYLDFYENKKSIKAYKTNIDNIKKLNKGDYEKFLYEQFGNKVTPDAKIVTAKPKPKYNALEANDAMPALLTMGKGRKLSAYNKFVKEYFKKHKGATLKDAAKAYRNK